MGHALKRSLDVLIGIIFNDMGTELQTKIRTEKELLLELNLKLEFNDFINLIEFLQSI